uniref:RNase H type-1 domain-containing protein n=1 Tax=Hordeum vulgare subsp. vulgare TaxID=112509 RepID=A0A8I6XAA5_HORVV
MQLDNVRDELMSCHGPLRVLQRIMQLPYDQKMKTVALLWCWWSERNKENQNQKRLADGEFQFLVTRHINEWVQFYKPKPVQKVCTARRWIPPPENFVKLNTDGAFMEQSHSGGWGAIARDYMGEIIFAAAGSAQHLSDALHAETMALQNGLRIADQMGIGRVIISTDSQVLKSALECSGLDHSWTILAWDNFFLISSINWPWSLLTTKLNSARGNVTSLLMF